MTNQHGIRRAAIATGLAAVLVVTGCTHEPVADPPARPGATSPPSTLTRVAVGDQMTVTAAVDRIVDDALVVRDVDLTEGTLLVLTEQAVDASPPQLVTVEGTVVRFSYRDLAAHHRLSDREAYRPFEGQKALVASRVTVWR
ncbi:hypothetical protein SAMN05443287_104526 [Micromonospora phaseoli]|uniref:Uncharacterized protein n=2 Tax=Micromonospora phaseoli TaxID=1144548 RepID=A0A1H6Z2M4_9ACTN|nr:hypothetical protein CLV64_103525 [Micromonospora phaseoli]GIJ80943.1 hypothetical protein Xph01_53750 [Micromonospora phaseoli]SEJ46254.1 hypothetical protein SAMN05443287_104526 [Micromonospora phaseoli]